MWRDGRLFIIDFQDARMGPDTYDLVSLLRDSYVDISEDVLEDYIAYFLAFRGGTPSPEERREFRRRFDLMALQRNLKALGTFGYQTATRSRRSSPPWSTNSRAKRACSATGTTTAAT
jgi:hypothetical protein